MFDDLNRRYWRGRLPRYHVIRRAALKGGRLGVCRDEIRTILLRADLQGEELRLTLLHEMCHIGTGKGLLSRPPLPEKDAAHRSSRRT